ncbi:23S rRNA (guanosine2251-2'-O)-methyltransferase [Breznakia sp. PF5-3]|uniref:23S rRNA (guanosine(2251)-2'-O)-methyltransferase RlmB n=1 Tax=unclassified Breznakia TaxID=2623764 RepID=UPI002406F139|nr:MULTISPECIES: 23S rRNA (guanosine(2251)-2'-O)-methyltransferase RlmB [unclassified Breznakia]MDL2276551.1 23S rRNA (guanosine(2251)-2'-O)-methyltransferase RlmB [Breznakia sp. OttesenSCG-928-G09]MDF9825544.1 23S rRNA (guanosine2251-2'-O)-methyltransferase [Breznakia sp. PM6-1]MDF9836412.1 23S rRNA (guanosine2251-2'-O)-methyltransferase [Breznakia sp. PF5-3]MDF9838198.1 23S rRNA (guanosine2251-2'-O)-methyltransferase [Breznakia sp. PFB2-8]MDF9860209.1 23S rRNA (guanosine2251-2'-O)-methyltran
MKQYVYGKNVVKQLLEDDKKIYEINIFENFKDKDILSVIYYKGIKLSKVSKKRLDQLSNFQNHQGIVATIDAYRYYELSEVLKHPKGKYPLLVMLDGIEDPHNLGAILRTCDAVNVDGVIIGKHRSVELNATVAKVSTGAIDHVPVCKVTNLSKTLQSLKDEGFWVIGTDMENASDYHSVDYRMPLVLVIGSEGFGISNLVKKNCDYFISLPMEGHVTSLNASVACGVLLYEIFNNRRDEMRDGESSKK